ncbi:hypothetical protein Brsp01_32160 [Brucella sp. NBRC 12950]|nr:hypothetical protein Brsp01_32160 [Brucella sp. NBRC 12950]
MGNHAMLLEKHTAVRKGRVHDGKVMAMRSHLRWCSHGLEFTCWNREVIRLAFSIDAFDREIIAWIAIANAGISGSDVRDIIESKKESLQNSRFCKVNFKFMDQYTLKLEEVSGCSYYHGASCDFNGTVVDEASGI